MIAQKIQLTDEVNELGRAKKFEAAAILFRGGQGQRVQNELQAVLGEMEAEEHRLLAIRVLEAKRRDAQIKVILALGTILGLLITATAGWTVQRDNARRGRAEAALRVSEEQYRRLIEGAQDYAIFMLGRHGEIRSWNAGTGE